MENVASFLLRDKDMPLSERSRLVASPVSVVILDLLLSFKSCSFSIFSVY